MQDENLAAIDRVPANAQNRERLASLLETVGHVLTSTDPRDMIAVRVTRVASLMRRAEAMPRKGPETGKAYAELRRAINATRQFGRSHKLKPDTRGDVVREARIVLDSLR